MAVDQTLHEHRFVIADRDGVPLSEVPAGNPQWSFALNEQGAANFTLPLQHPKSDPDVLAPGERQLLIYRENDLKWGGWLETAAPSTEQDIVRFGAIGWFGMLKYRLVTETLKFVGEDQFDIAWDLIDYTQGKTNGDLGITRGGAANIIPLQNQKDINSALGSNEWTSILSATVARTTTGGEVDEGAASLRITAHASNTFSGATCGASSGSTNVVPVVPNRWYNFSAYFKGSGAHNYMIRARWLDAGGTGFVNTDSGTFVASASAFQRQDFKALAPPGAAFVRFQILFPTAGSSQIVYADRFQVEEGQTASTWPGSLAVSGIDRDRTYPFWERNNIGTEIQALTEVGNGFDFIITPDKVFKMYHPRKGAQLKTPFELGKNIGGMGVTNDASDINNWFDAIGAGDGKSTCIASAADLPSQAKYGLREVAESFTEVRRFATLQDRADEGLRLRLNMREQPSLSIRTEDPLPYEYSVGDTVTIRANRGYLQLDKEFRIISLSYALSNEGRESVTVQFQEEE